MGGSKTTTFSLVMTKYFKCINDIQMSIKTTTNLKVNTSPLKVKELSKNFKNIVLTTGRRFI